MVFTEPVATLPREIGGQGRLDFALLTGDAGHSLRSVCSAKGETHLVGQEVGNYCIHVWESWSIPMEQPWIIEQIGFMTLGLLLGGPCQSSVEPPKNELPSGFPMENRGPKKEVPQHKTDLFKGASLGCPLAKNLHDMPRLP